MSLRKAIIEELVIDMELSLDHVETSDEEDELLDNLHQDLFTVISCRYLRKNGPVPKSASWLAEVLPSLDDKRFKIMMRMTRKEFFIILELLEGMDTFQTKRQLPLSVQLAVVLYRLGSYGSGSSIPKLATLFGLGDGGTIDRITLRLFQAVLSFENTYIRWPTDEERAQIVDKVGDDLPQCIGFLDGSDFNLAEAPSLDHSSYFSRKQRYAIKAQAVCDYDLRIRHLHVGYPGSVHDSRIFNNSDLGVNPSRYFTGAQWLAADSAYKLQDTVLTPFRKNSTFQTAQERERFNRYFSSYRVKIEQSFGILKEKFSSLKELRTRVKDRNSHSFVCAWIRVCVILHNILLPYYEEEDFNYDPDLNDGDQDDFVVHDGNTGSTKRAALFSLLEDKFK